VFPFTPMNVTGATQSARKRRKKIAGIGRAAVALQVTRQHLRLVIRGYRASKSLLARYRMLKAERAKGGHRNASLEDRGTKFQ
jgi:hypothetical protein